MLACPFRSRLNTIVVPSGDHAGFLRSRAGGEPHWDPMKPGAIRVDHVQLPIGPLERDPTTVGGPAVAPTTTAARRRRTGDRIRWQCSDRGLTRDAESDWRRTVSSPPVHHPHRHRHSPRTRSVPTRPVHFPGSRSGSTPGARPSPIPSTSSRDRKGGGPKMVQRECCPGSRCPAFPGDGCPYDAEPRPNAKTPSPDALTTRVDDAASPALDAQ